MNQVLERLKPKPHWGAEFFRKYSVPNAWLASYLGIDPGRVSRILGGIVPCPEHIEQALLQIQDDILLEEASEDEG